MVDASGGETTGGGFGGKGRVKPGVDLVGIIKKRGGLLFYFGLGSGLDKRVGRFSIWIGFWV